MSKANRAGKALLLAVTVMVLIGGCNSKHKGPGRVYNSKHKVSIVPPSGWVDRGPFMGTAMFFAGPQEGSFTVNLNVYVNPAGGDKIEQAPVEVKRMLGQTMPNYQVVEDGFVTLDGRKAYRISGTFTGGVVEMQNLQYMMIVNDKVYTLTFTSARASFQSHLPVFEGAATTMRAG